MFYNLLNKIKNNPQNYFPILIIFIVGFLLRMYKISDSYIWRDEAYTWNTIQFGFNNIFEATRWDTHPPVYSYLLFFWTQVFGDSAYGMRLMSLFFGMIAVFAMYFFALKQTKSIWIANISSLLVAVNPELIVYSQEARSYSIFVAVLIALFYFLSEKLNLKNLIISILISLFGLFTHSLFLLVIPLVYIWHWYFYGKNNLKKVLMLFTGTIIGYAPYLTVLKQQTKDKGSDFWLKFNPFNALQDNLPAFFTSQLYSSNNAWTSLMVNTILYTVLIGMVFGIIQEYKNNRIRLVIIPLIFLAATYLVSFYSPVFYIRYIQFIIPFVVVILAIGFYRVYVNNKLVGVFFVTLLCLASTLLYLVDIKNTPMNKNYNQVINAIGQSEEKNVFNANPDITFDVIQYYIKSNKLELNNLVLQYPQITKKQFQNGIFRPTNYVKDINALKSFVVVTEWDNQDAKAYINGLNFCIVKTDIIDGINLDYYNKCVL